MVSLDKSLAFYNGLLGLKTDAPRTASAKDTPPPPILQLEGTPDARMRWSHVTFPGTQWWAEPLEFGDIDRKPVTPRLQDPGAVTLIFHVRGLDGVLARLKQAGTPIVTPGGSPLSLNPGVDKSRAVIVKDPDGHFVQLVEPDPIPADAPASDLIDGHVRITIGDTDKTMRLYRDLLGFQPTVGAFARNKAFAALTGLKDHSSGSRPRAFPASRGCCSSSLNSRASIASRSRRTSTIPARHGSCSWSETWIQPLTSSRAPGEPSYRRAASR